MMGKNHVKYFKKSINWEEVEIKEGIIRADACKCMHFIKEDKCVRYSII